MKTIVINTSKEAKNAKLDVLFNAPFDRSTLLRYECELHNIEEMASVIKQALITDADMIDRDYNLIVLVDLYEFPRGDEICVANVYKQLVSRYVGAMLIEPLKEQHNLLPKQSAIFYADSANKSENYVPEYRNEKERMEQSLNEQSSQKAEIGRLDADGNLCISGCDEPEIISSVSDCPEDIMLMSLFSWHNKIKKSEFSWKLKYSIADDVYLDFSKAFSDISSSIENSHKTADVLSIALNELTKKIACSGDMNLSASQAVVVLKGFHIKIHTCKFNRDNEQNLKEGFFDMYVNIFKCVQMGCIPENIKKYSSEEIKEMLIKASRRYEYFLDDKNISVKLKPISAIFKNKDSIFRDHKKHALEKSQYKDMDENKVADSIMESSRRGKSVNAVDTTKMKGIDLRFHNLVNEIFSNFDDEIIKKQNDYIVKNCMLTLWDWRDRCTNKDFSHLVDNVCKDVDADKAESDASVTFFAEEHEKEYNRLVGEITSVEHRLSSNKNILLETQNAVIEYGSLMKKGKRYLLGFIGAVIAVIASGVPFIYMHSATGGKMFNPISVYLLFTAGFSLIYAIASAIYMSVINREKLKLSFKLDGIKEESENDRKESIIALYHYYSETIIEANCHYLLWKELLRREKENAGKFIMRNAHLTHLHELKGIVDRYITMFKIDPSKYPAEGDFQKMTLIGEEPFYSENNKVIYSILPIEKKNKYMEREGEELQ